MSINQCQEGLTNFYSMFAEFFNESDKVHPCPVVANPQQRDEHKHYPHISVVTYTEESNSDDEDITMPPLIYPEQFNVEESLSNPPYADPTPEPGPPIEKPI